MKRSPLAALFRKIYDFIILSLATGFGIGLMPKAPGTFGSLWGLVLVYAVQTNYPGPQAMFVAGIITIIVGVFVCDRAGRYFGQKDPGKIIIDEVASFPIVFWGITLNFQTAIIGFLLFRLFDISKPWPIKKLEKLPGGVGVMADDLLAGVYAWILFNIILYFF
jgi:phosphatidylglycerophosphatase A